MPCHVCVGSLYAVEYIHLSPVKAGLGRRPEDWAQSRIHKYAGNFNDKPVTPSGLSIDRVELPVTTTSGSNSDARLRAAEYGKPRPTPRLPLPL